MSGVSGGVNGKDNGVTWGRMGRQCEQREHATWRGAKEDNLSAKGNNSSRMQRSSALSASANGNKRSEEIVSSKRREKNNILQKI